MTVISFVTGNVGKLREVESLLQGRVSFEAVKLDLVEIQGPDCATICIEKAKEAFRLLKRPVLIEDSGLSFDALQGLPGPYIKWFYDKIGNDGLYKMLQGFPSKSAWASCTFTLCLGDGEMYSFEGRIQGTIVEPAGEGGFGWDPLFKPLNGGGKTYAEMSAEEKNLISHRSVALSKLVEFLLKKNSLHNEAS